MIDPATLVPALCDLDIVLNKQEYYDVVELARRTFVKSWRERDERTITRVCYAILWTCINHPKIGPEFNSRLSEALRRGNRCHVTWHCSNRLAIAFGTKFVDLKDMTTATAPDGVTLYSGARSARPEDLN
jgi:hypothetical protein